MAATFRASQESTGYNTSCAEPASAQPGDVMVISVTWFYAVGGTLTLTNSGTSVTTTSHGRAQDTGSASCEVFTYVRGASASGPWQATLSTGGDHLINVTALSDVDTTTPVSIAQTQGNNTAFSSVSVPDDGSLLFLASSSYFNTVTGISGTPVFTRRDATADELGIYTAPFDTGATGSITRTGGDNAAVLLVIKPAAGGGSNSTLGTGGSATLGVTGAALASSTASASASATVLADLSVPDTMVTYTGDVLVTYAGDTLVSLVSTASSTTDSAAAIGASSTLTSTGVALRSSTTALAATAVVGAVPSTGTTSWVHSAWQQHSSYPWGVTGWNIGTTLIVDQDVGGNGEIFFPVYAEAAGRLDLAVSDDQGATWSYVGQLGGASFNPGTAPLSAAQDSTGALHVITAAFAGTFSYFRLTLNRTSGAITSFSVAQAPFAIGASSPAVAGDFRGTIRVVTSQNGTECLAWIGSDQPLSTTDARVVAQKTASITPSGSSSFTKFDGTAGFDTIWTDTINPHEFCPHLAQIPSTRDMWVVWGHHVGQGFTTATTHSWRRCKLSTSGALTWSIGAWTVQESNTMIHTVCASSDRVYILRDVNDTGTHISTIDGSDTYTADAVSSPTAGRFTGTRQAGMDVSADNTKIFCAWQTWVGYATGVECVKAGYVGGAWTLFTDTTQDAFGDSWGILASHGPGGWQNGAVFLRIATDTYNRTPWTSTLYLDVSPVSNSALTATVAAGLAATGVGVVASSSAQTATASLAAAPSVGTSIIHKPWTHTGVGYANQYWANGEPRSFQDVGASTNLVWPAISISNGLRLFTSQDLGTSWSPLAELAGGTPLTSYNLQSAVQSSDGRIHLCLIGFGTHAYARLTLNYTASNITSYTVEAGPYAIGDSSTLSDSCCSIRVVENQSGTQCLMMGWLHTGGGGFVACAQKTLNTTPASSSDWTRLDGTAGHTVLETRVTPASNGHEQSIIFGQIPSTKAVWFLTGRRPAEGVIDGFTTNRIKATTSGSTTWSVASPIVGIADAHPRSIACAADKLFVLSNYVNSGAPGGATGLSIDRIDSADVYTRDAITAPPTDTAGEIFQGAISCNSSGSRVYVGWQTWSFDSVPPAHCRKAAYVDSAWTEFTDTTDSSDGDCWGYGTSTNFDGLIAIRHDDTAYSSWVSTIYATASATADSNAPLTAGGTLGASGTALHTSTSSATAAAQATASSQAIAAVTASFSATGVLTSTAEAVATSAVALSASAVLAAAVVSRINIDAAVAAAGSLSAAGQAISDAVIAFAATASLAAGAVQVQDGAVTISAAAGATTVGAALASSSVLQDAAAGLSSAGVALLSSAASISALSVLNAVAQASASSASAFQATTALTASAGVIYSSSATFSGEATTSASAVAVFPATVQVQGSAGMSAVPTATAVSAAVMSATAALDAAPNGATNSTSSFTAFGEVSASSAATAASASALSASGSLVGVGVALVSSTTTCTASASLSAAPVAQVAASSALTGAASAQAQGVALVDSTSVYSCTATLDASHTGASNAFASCTGSAQMTAVAEVWHTSTASLSGSSSLAASGAARSSSTAGFSASTSLLAGSVSAINSAAALAGQVAMLISASSLANATAFFSQQSTLNALATATANASVSFAGTANVYSTTNTVDPNLRAIIFVPNIHGGVDLVRTPPGSEGAYAYLVLTTEGVLGRSDRYIGTQVFVNSQGLFIRQH